MARQPNPQGRCRRLWLCALFVCAGLPSAVCVGQLPPPNDGPLLTPSAAGPAMPGYPTNPQSPQTAAPNYSPAIPSVPQPGQGGYTPPAARASAPQEENVVEVRVEGNRTVATHKIMSQIHTRSGRAYSVETVQDDVRALTRMGLFVDVRPWVQRAPNGAIVVFRVVERPLLQDVIIIGNDIYKTSTLKKEAEVKTGDAADPFAVENGRRRIEEYYQKHGYSKVRVTILEGAKAGDSRVVYMVNEGPHQRIFWVNFVGNKFVSAARLKTLIQTHPPYFYLFSGEFDRKQIDEDVSKLTAYYRGFGYFHARIGRELEYNEKQNWVTVTYVIDEGPRYAVRNISFLGNRKFDNPRLAEKLKLLSGQYFDQNQQNLDLAQLRDEYGGEGFVFAKIEADNRFLEEPGKLDIVYNVEEGDRYRIGPINIEIKGENPHTQITTVLNRLSVKPGDIADTREIRASERRLKAAQLYKVEPMRGVEPKIAYAPPDSDGSMVAGRRRTTYYRFGNSGSLPPLPPGERYLPLNFSGEYAPPENDPQVQQATYAEPSGPPTTYREQAAPPTAGLSPMSRPMYYDTRYEQYNGWSQPQSQMQGQSWGPNNQYGGNNAYPTDQSQNYSAAQPQQNYPPAQPVQPYGYAQQPQADGYAQQPSNGYVQPTQYNAPAQQQPAAPLVYNPPPQQYPQPYPAQDVPQPAAADNVGGGQLYTPSGPAADQPVARVANGGDLFANPLPTIVPTPTGDPLRDLPLTITPEETQTGRLMFGVGVNSDAGVMGSVTIDEQNFDWRNVPTSWQDVWEGRAFRGAGERFRMELVPGTQVQRYLISYQDPYLNNQPVSLGLSAFFYQRLYSEWTEQRVGGSMSLGYQFTHDLTGTLRFQGQDVKITNPEYPVPDLLAVLGYNQLYTFSASLQHDTRDNPFMATEGHLLSASLEETLGTFQYPRASIEFSQFYRIFQRADRSGNHVLNLQLRAAYSGDETPIFERFYLGGFSSLRGFAFRGVTPRDPVYGMGVGGNFQLQATAQYTFPITADDMLKGVVFCDAGTVEPTITNWNQQVRVAPGFGLRISIPMMGPAPIALDFAFPLNAQYGDVTQMFSFFVGFNR